MRVTSDGGDAGADDVERWLQEEGATVTSDTFVLTVNEDSVHLSEQELRDRAAGATPPASVPAEAIKCAPGSSVTKATIVIDSDVDAIDVTERLQLLTRIATHLHLPENIIRMLASEGKPLVDESALVSGSGNVEAPAREGGASFVEWEVGCGNVHVFHMPVLQALEDNAKQGKMADDLGRDVIGWHVTNHRPPLVRRLRREAEREFRQRNRNRNNRNRDRNFDFEDDEASGFFETDPTTTSTERTRPTTTTTTTTTTPTTTTERRRTHRTKTHGRHTRPRSTTPTSTTTTPTTTTPERRAPVVRHPIGRLEARVGETFVFHVPRKTFRDAEDGSTKNLTLFMKTFDRNSLTPASWVEFIPENQLMIGMPLADHEGTYQYRLTAMDSGGQMTEDVFTIEVLRAETRDVTHRIVTRLDDDFDAFLSQVQHRLNVARAIAGAFGDADSSSLSILDIKRGSVLFEWTNNSLSSDGRDAAGACPVEQVRAMARRMVDEKGEVSGEFARQMLPRRVTRVSVVAEGACVGVKDFPAVNADDVYGSNEIDVTEVGVVDPTKKKEETVSATLMGTVLPVVTVLLLVVVIVVVVWCLCRKRQPGKKLSEDPNSTFTKKSPGAPVIFAHELDERKDPASKPLIDNPRAPPPPGYPKGASPGSSHRQPLLDRSSAEPDSMDGDYSSRNGTSRRNQHMQPTFR